MYILSATDLIRVWEIGVELHPLDRAITFLAAALPEMSPAELVRLSIGQRDGLLLRLYEQTFGPQLGGRATCPNCQETVEFTLQVADVSLPSLAPGITGEVESDGTTFTFRLPNSLDLAALLRLDDAGSARRLLAERCLVRVMPAVVAAETLFISEQTLAQLAAQMATLDPQAEIELDLICTRCEQHWSVLLDIVSFFWMDLTRLVKRLLYDVHLLATAYGWCEADILAMSAARRQIYLAFVGT